MTQLNLPGGWTPAQLTCFLPELAQPNFVPTAQMTLRTDTDPDEPLADIADTDLVQIREHAEGFQLLRNASTQLGNRTAHVTEYSIPDATIGSLSHVTFYFTCNQQIYVILGSHLSEHMEAMRAKLDELARHIAEQL